MASQNWIYDPPPPPPKLAKQSSQVYASQRGGNGRDGSRGGSRGSGGQSGTGHYSRQYNIRPTSNQQTEPSRQIFPQQMNYYPPGGFPQRSVYPQQQWASVYPQYPVQQNMYMYPQLPMTYPQQNIHGYTMSSTSYSLPAHHSKPVASERPDLSEEELRSALEQASEKLKPVIPIEGTNIQLITIEDIMAWRAERKKKWLTKIAPADGPVRKRKRDGRLDSSQDKQKPAPQETAQAEMKRWERLQQQRAEVIPPNHPSRIHDNSELEEGEVAEKVQDDTGSVKLREMQKRHPGKPSRKFPRGSRGKNISVGIKREASTFKDDGVSNVEKSKTLYATLLRNQMERENIILLQALLSFRKNGLLDLE